MLHFQNDQTTSILVLPNFILQLDYLIGFSLSTAPHPPFLLSVPHTQPEGPYWHWSQIVAIPQSEPSQGSISLRIKDRFLTVAHKIPHHLTPSYSPSCSLYCSHTGLLAVILKGRHIPVSVFALAGPSVLEHSSLNFHMAHSLMSFRAYTHVTFSVRPSLRNLFKIAISWCSLLRSNFFPASKVFSLFSLPIDNFLIC